MTIVDKRSNTSQVFASSSTKLLGKKQLYRNRWRDATGAIHHLSQEELSIRLGYGENTYGQWERRRGKPTHRQAVVKLVQVFL